MQVFAYLDPRGRIGRAGFVIGLVLALPPLVLLALSPMPAPFATASASLQILLIWACHCLIAKRLHDMALSAWWCPVSFLACCIWTAAVAIGLMTTLGFGAMAIGHVGNVVLSMATLLPILVALLWLGMVPGRREQNRHGPAPARMACVMPWHRPAAPVSLYGQPISGQPIGG
jgi:uncharacterized membrane protein YhaH (DUF805 family)